MASILSLPRCVNKQNICEMYYTPVKATLGVSWGPIEGLWGSQKYIPALVQVMAWRRPGDKPLSEPMIVIQSNLTTLL